MNPFLNPFTGFPFLRDFITDPRRLQRLTPEKLNRYRNKSFRKALAYAWTVPVYREKYQNHGITPDTISNLDEIDKLPLITKRELLENYPDKVVPLRYKKEKAQMISTSGSSGKILTFYSDFLTMSKAATISIRELQTYGLQWNASKIAYVINFNTYQVNEAINQGLVTHARTLSLLSNHLQMNPFQPIPELLSRLDEFEPEAIVSYPATFQNLAYLKSKGYGPHVKPKILIVGGYVLDPYIRNYVEQAFNCKMVNVYGSAESGGDITFECLCGTWHIHQDLYNVEAVDKNMQPVESGKKGRIIVTRLFGRGTPFIRYTGMDDLIIIEPTHECECGLTTPSIKSVVGRIGSTIVLPDGRIYPSASFSIMSSILNDLKTNKVRQFQIVQKTLDEIEISLVFDDENRNSEPSVDDIIKAMETAYIKMVGSAVTITVREKKEIASEEGKPFAFVISNVNRDKIEEMLDSLE